MSTVRRGAADLGQYQVSDSVMTIGDCWVPMTGMSSPLARHGSIQAGGSASTTQRQRIPSVPDSRFLIPRRHGTRDVHHQPERAHDQGMPHGPVRRSDHRERPLPAAYSSPDGPYIPGTGMSFKRR